MRRGHRCALQVAVGRTVVKDLPQAGGFKCRGVGGENTAVWCGRGTLQPGVSTGGDHLRGAHAIAREERLHELVPVARPTDHAWDLDRDHRARIADLPRDLTPISGPRSIPHPLPLNYPS